MTASVSSSCGGIGTQTGEGFFRRVAAMLQASCADADCRREPGAGAISGGDFSSANFREVWPSWPLDRGSPWSKLAWSSKEPQSSQCGEVVGKRQGRRGERAGRQFCPNFWRSYSPVEEDAGSCRRTCCRTRGSSSRNPLAYYPTRTRTYHYYCYDIIITRHGVIFAANITVLHTSNAVKNCGNRQPCHVSSCHFIRCDAPLIAVARALSSPELRSCAATLGRMAGCA